MGRDLKQEAEHALAAGEIERALEAYQRLELTFHDEPSWSRQVATLHGKLGDESACVEALTRAAERCVARQEPLKAIAACKLIQAIDPEHARARRMMNELLGAPPPAPELPIPNLISDLSLPLPRRRSEKGALQLIAEGAVRGEIPLFSLFSRKNLERLLKQSRLMPGRAGDVVFRQRDRGDSLYIVIEGGVSVFLEEEPRVHLADLGEGSFFGEIALIFDRPRGATIECRIDSELLEISRAALLEALKDEPSANAVLVNFLRERLVDIVVKTGPLFSLLETDAERADLASRFSLLDAGEGAVLIEQGKQAEGLYVLVDGSADVIRETEFEDFSVAVLEAGHLFGEISTITHLPAVARVVTAEPSLLLFLPADKIDDAIRRYPRLLTYATELANARITQLEALQNGDHPRIALF